MSYQFLFLLAILLPTTPNSSDDVFEVSFSDAELAERNPLHLKLAHGSFPLSGVTVPKAVALKRGTIRTSDTHVDVELESQGELDSKDTHGAAIWFTNQDRNGFKVLIIVLRGKALNQPLDGLRASQALLMDTNGKVLATVTGEYSTKTWRGGFAKELLEGQTPYWAENFWLPPKLAAKYDVFSLGQVSSFLFFRKKTFKSWWPPSVRGILYNYREQKKLKNDIRQ